MNKTKFLFNFLLCVIVFLVMLIGSLTSQISFSRKRLKDWLDHFDQTAGILMNQVKIMRGVTPEGIGIQSIKVFVVNLNDGSMVFDRQTKDNVYDDLWESHRSKLIYEMQNQKTGWIFYPETSSPDARGINRVIRYATMDDLGWIVVVESDQPTELYMFNKSFDKGLYIKLFIVIFLTYPIILLLTNFYSAVLKKTVSENLENSFLNFNSKDLIKNVELQNKIKTNPMQPVDHPSLKSTSHIQELRPSQPEVPVSFVKEQTNPGLEIKSVTSDVLVQPAAVTKPYDQPLAPPLEQEASLPAVNNFQIEKKQSLPEPLSKKPQIILKEEARRKPIETKDDSPYKDMTIDTQGIKSPLLKKMINQLRNK